MQRFTAGPRHILPGVTIAALCLAFAGVGRADSPVYQSLLHSTGLVEVPDSEGSVTFGTCSVVDRERGLALTAQHVIGDAAEAVVYFPVYRDGAAITELPHYHRQVAAVRGQVIHRDAGRDLALLRLDRLPDHIVAIPLSAQGAGPGDTVHSIGNSGVRKGQLWGYTAGKARSVYRSRIRGANGVANVRLVETQTPINPGDSGAPLVNDGGELVGVVKSLDDQSRLVSFNVDVSEVKAFLGVAYWNQVRPILNAAFGLTPESDAADANRQSPPVEGSWKVTLINRDGEQQSGECRFETNGTFALTAHAAAGLETRRGRYSYANGVLLMAGDRFNVRETLHWVKDRRFTFVADEMLIFDRQPDASAAAESPLPKATTIEHTPPPTQKASGPGTPISGQRIENDLESHSPAGPVPPAEVRSTGWVTVIALVGAMSALAFLAIWNWSHRKSMSRTVPSDDLLPGWRQTRA
jgi:hypothetical protein